MQKLAWAWIRKVVGVCCLLACSPPVSTVSAELPDVPGLASFESRSYEVHTDLDEARAVRYAQHLDKFFVVYSELLKSLPGEPRGRQKVYLFADQASYIRGLTALGIDRSSAENSGGMFFVNPRGSALAAWQNGVGAPAEAEMLRVLQHEGFHQFAAAKGGAELPRWVNEGLAEYFEVAVLKGRRIRRGLVPPIRLAELKLAAAESRLIPFEELLQLDGERWFANMADRSSGRGYLQYLQSWLTVQYLLHGDGGRHRRRFGDFMKRIALGEPAGQAFRRAFEIEDVTPFGAAIDRYLDGLKAKP